MEPRPGDITLALDDLRLVVNPQIGASVVSLQIKDDAGGWASVLRSMPADSTSSSDAGSFVMLPWTNRIKDAGFSYEGTEHTLRSNMDDDTAIHGVGRDLPWSIADRSPITARFVFDSRSHDPELINYPFKFGGVQRFEISPDSLDIDLSITNLNDRPIPVGCGHHPYIHRHLFSQDDELSIKLDVTGRYPCSGCIPTGEPVDDAVCRSLRAGGPIGNPGLDDVFNGFGSIAEFCWDKSKRSMTMHCTDNLNHLVIYTPRGGDGEPGEFVCVEPVSMVNDGFNRLNNGHAGSGVVVLGPNETMRTRMRFEFAAI